MDKRPIFDWFYDQGDIYVTVITTNSPLLIVPPESMQKKFEKFIIGETSASRLSYNEIGINVSMRFGARYEECFLPWDSIVIMEGNEAVIQFTVDDIGVDDIEEEPDKEDTTEKVIPEGENKRRGNLKLVE